ncbi:MAG TPA: hypothetical protein VGU27_02260 [Candidatus Eisenbacteria bacterium]|nr:hypothetical protein [Candidatus Eisenbacteria bacterium]
MRWSPRLRGALVALALIVPVLWAGVVYTAVRVARSPGGVAAALARVPRAADALAGVPRAALAAVTATWPGLAEAAATPSLPAGSSSSTTWSWSGDDGHRFEFALLDGQDAYVNVPDGDTWRSLRALRGSGSGPVLWCRLDGGDAYVIRDRATLDKARALTAPSRDLGREQGELGRRQGRLGVAQGRLGGRLGALAARLARVEARVAEARRDRGDDPDVDRELADVKDGMAQLRHDQEPIVREQRELGDQQRELGRRQREASEHARRELRGLVEDAVRKGLAERLHDET